MNKSGGWRYSLAAKRRHPLNKSLNMQLPQQSKRQFHMVFTDNKRA
jgi:hypothetical protein